jgi:hypothetical protein
MLSGSSGSPNHSPCAGNPPVPPSLRAGWRGSHAAAARSCTRDRLQQKLELLTVHCWGFVTPCSAVRGTDVSEKYAASICRVEVKWVGLSYHLSCNLYIQSGAQTTNTFCTRVLICDSRLCVTLYNLMALLIVLTATLKLVTEFMTETLLYTHQTTRRHKRKITIWKTATVNTWTFIKYIILIFKYLVRRRDM